jgi:hypothetical protein
VRGVEELALPQILAAGFCRCIEDAIDRRHAAPGALLARGEIAFASLLDRGPELK